MPVAMSTFPSESSPQGEHRELPVEEQLQRAREWDPAEAPLFEDLPEDEQTAFLAAVAQ